MKCLDVGCGVGGPARNIARFSRADITGVTINAYQVARGTAKCQKEGIDHKVHLVQVRLDLTEWFIHPEARTTVVPDPVGLVSCMETAMTSSKWHTRARHAHVASVAHTTHTHSHTHVRIAHIAAVTLSHALLCQGDFMALPFEPESFDRVYEIEATCHAPDRAACFKQIFDVLKPGGIFAG
jgi:ubiquinone/menaquinone biosynthesis C-methylase UbiE